MTVSIYEQSAVIPYRQVKKGIEVLLVTTTSGKKWTIPKGIVESDLDARASAAKEALEEAGVRGEVSTDVLGEYTYTKWGGTCHVLVFAMLVTKELSHWEEEDIRSRKWLPALKARNVLHDPGQRRLMKRFCESFLP